MRKILDTTQRCHAASGKNSAALSESPMQASEMITEHRQATVLEMFQERAPPALSSLAPSQMPRISR